MTRRRWLSLVAGLVLGGGAMAGGVGPALGATALPAHVYSPYFETWTTDSLTTIAQQSA